MDLNEYEIQHFGFFALQTSLERKHVLQKIVRKALNAIFNDIASYSTTKTMELLEQEKQNIYNSIMMSFESRLKNLSEMDRKYFSIPSHVLLPSDFDYANEYSAFDEKSIDKELERLKQKFLENAYMIQCLKMENELYESIQHLVNEELQVQSKVQQSLNAINLDELTMLAREAIDVHKKL